MRLNGSVHIARNRDMSYSLAYAPLGVSSRSRPVRPFAHRKELDDFLASELKIGNREINMALSALFRNGSYAIWEVWLTEEEIARPGSGPSGPFTPHQAPSPIIPPSPSVVSDSPDTVPLRATRSDRKSTRLNSSHITIS